MAWNKKNKGLKSLENFLKRSEVVVYSGATDYFLWEFQNISATDTCGLTKYRLHEAVSLLQFFRNFKKATP